MYGGHGKHEIFAGCKHVPLKAKDQTLVLREEIVTMEEQHDLHRPRIAKTAREEKIRARDAKLKEQPGPVLVQIGTIAPAPKPAPSVQEREEAGSCGDQVRQWGGRPGLAFPARPQASCSTPILPSRKSPTAWTVSSREFITNGPYRPPARRSALPR